MKTLLILDDEPSVIRLLRLIVRQYNILESASADEAVGLFQDRACQIDLLIADVTLPVSSGVLVALRLRAENPDLPVILTSGYPVSAWNITDAAGLRRLGPRSLVVLQKPFQSKALVQTVSELLGGYKAVTPASA